MVLGDRYLRLPLYALNYNQSSLNLIENYFNEDNFQKFQFRGFCSFVYSNAKATSPRDYFFRLLDERKRVSSGGHHLNNVGFFVDDKVAFESKYKFSVAFENTSYPGYTTEKLLDSFAAGSIPIYFGDQIVCEDIYPESFINLHNFESLEAGADFIINIESDFEKLKSIYLSRKFKPHVYQYEEKLFEFLDNIFSQSNESVFRRPYSNRSIMKLRKLRFLSLVHKVESILRYLVRPIKKILNRLRLVFRV